MLARVSSTCLEMRWHDNLPRTRAFCIPSSQKILSGAPQAPAVLLWTSSLDLPSHCPPSFQGKEHPVSPNRRQRCCVLNHWTPSKDRDPDKQPSAPSSASLMGQPRRKGCTRASHTTAKETELHHVGASTPPEWGEGCRAFGSTLGPQKLCICSRCPSGISEKGS